MKMLKSLFLCSLLTTTAFFISSCDNDDDDVTPTDQTIVGVAASNANFSILVAAIQNVSANTGTNVAALLSDETQKFTVFAPTNDAFIAAGLDQSFVSNPSNAQAVLDVLTYHVIGAAVKASEVPAGPNAAQKAISNQDLFLTRDSRGVFVNGIPVATADVNATNGVIHAIPTVLMPPSGNIVETAVAANFNLLVAAIQYVDAELNAGIATALSGSGPFTVFAPTDAAFIAALDGADGSTKDNAVSTAELQALGASAIAAILQAHVVPGRVFSSDLTNGLKPSTLNTGADITINLSGDVATIAGAGNTAAKPAITATNVVTTNGVIHIINQVILP